MARNTNRQAAGQQQDETVCVCGHEKVGHGSLDFSPVRCLNCHCRAYTPAVGQQPTQQPATEPLIDAERQFLALDLASDRMANHSGEFEDGDWAILARLRRLADGGA